jgi:hypothetical protein
MSRILIGKGLGSSEKWVSYYNYMVPVWVANRGNTKYNENVKGACEH